MNLGINDGFKFEKRGQAPGSAINTKVVEGSEEEFTKEAEFYQLPGFISGPTKGDRLVLIPMEGGYEVVVASHNYRVGVSVTAGQTKIYSTNASGTTKQAEIILDTNGKIKFSNSSKSLKTVLDSLIDEIIALKTFGSPANHLVDPETITNLQTIKSDLGGILY